MIVSSPMGPGWFIFFQDDLVIGKVKRRDQKCEKEICDEDNMVLEMITTFLKSR